MQIITHPVNQNEVKTHTGVGEGGNKHYVLSRHHLYVRVCCNVLVPVYVYCCSPLDVFWVFFFCGSGFVLVTAIRPTLE